ncbi:hydrogenase maturation protease [Clostridiaceae bacterium UIB06]|nr:hydrogenase maturation protease [Clostridiaceae bacterium UIB06]
MKIKVIAIGNELMEDDGIALIAVEKIREELIDNNIEVIIGETDFEYCISLVEEGDILFIIDASYYGKEPGKLTVLNLEKCTYRKRIYTQHSCSVIDLIKQYYKYVRGYIIGIEVSNISFKLGLSKELESKIDIISEKVLKYIQTKVLEYR